MILLGRDVAIIGIGSTNYTPMTTEYSYKELMFEAALKAYEDAGINPRKELDALVTAAEDFWEGISIFDEYIPDQLGAVLKPALTVSGDGLWGIIHGYMLVKTGYFDIVAVEAHSKASDIDNIMDVWRIALDPHYHRPIVDNVHIFAGLEMMRFMEEYNVSREALSMIVVKNRYNALYNPMAPYGTKTDIETVSNSEVVSYPLRKMDISEYSDGATVVVLASKEVAERYDKEPIWIEGVGWISDSPNIEEWDLACPSHVVLAASMAYSQANIDNPFKEIDLAEVDDRYSYREFQSLVALDLTDGYMMDELVFEGVISPSGELPVNPSGGYMGMGYPLEAGGLVKLYNAVVQLRGEAGPIQVGDVEKAVVMTRREFPSPSSAVVVLGR